MHKGISDCAAAMPDRRDLSDYSAIYTAYLSEEKITPAAGLKTAPAEEQYVPCWPSIWPKGTAASDQGSNMLHAKDRRTLDEHACAAS